MSRSSTVFLAALNIATHPHSAETYLDLWRKAKGKPAKIRGDNYGMIGSIYPLDKPDYEKGVYGSIYKFLKIDVTEPWFNTEKNEVATPEETAEIHIPDPLRPHLSKFQYIFFPNSHRLIFESKRPQHTLGPLSVERMFEELLNDVADEPVYVTAEQSGKVLQKILQQHIKQISIFIKPPNPDDIGGLEENIMEELLGQKAQRMEQTLIAQKNEVLQLSETTQALARVAQSNGHVQAKVVGPTGATEEVSTHSRPLFEPMEYNKKKDNFFDKFLPKAFEFYRNIVDRGRQ